MFNNKYQEYEQVANHDSGDEIELQQRSNNNTSQQPGHSSITDLLKLTAHRRIRSQSNSQSLDINNNNNTVITISDDDDTDSDDDNESQNLLNKPTPTENEDIMDDIDLLDNAHATTDTEGEEDDETVYDDHVFLLSLDGKKRKVGIMTSWKIRQLKEKYFKSEIKDGKNVRLIYRGKLLQDVDDINSYNIPSMGFIHVSVSKGRNLNGTGENGQFGTGDVNYDNFDDGMDDEAVARRLQEEINAGLMNDNSIPRWMRGGDRWNDGDEDRTNPDRARREFLCGVFLGCVAGIWILIFLILLAQRNQYSRRFRLGVTIGVGINLMINLSYQYNNDNNADDPAEDINNTSETDTVLSGDGGDGGVDDMGNTDGQEIETAAN